MMTERAHPLSPPIVSKNLALSRSVAPLHTRELSSNAITDGEDGEDDYTIKCICGFADDDGNTVLCDTCDSWQHILCFYPHDLSAPNRLDFMHKCHECQPRSLDGTAARRRQLSNRSRERSQRESDYTADEDGAKSSKKPTKKSHKKRTPSELQINGHDHDRPNKKTATHDATSSHKKTKTHRANGSVSHIKRSPSHTNGHPPSPATTPPDFPDDFRLHDYCNELQDRYDVDAVPLETNSFATVSLVSEMSSWATDPQNLRKMLRQEDVTDIIRSFKPGFNYDAYDWPKLQVKSEDVGMKDKPLQIKYLSVGQPCHNQILLGELKGLVGIQREFTIDSEFFTRLSHPPPFVFFHQELPLYIDTRREGSLCRYLRRSCKPNCTIDTYVTNASEYHFVVVNEGSVKPGDQLSLPWDIRFPSQVKSRYNSLLVPNQDDPDVKPAEDATDEEFDYLSDYIRSLLTEFGGCACGLGKNCSFVKFHRNYHGRLHAQSNGIKPKKSRKPKNAATTSNVLHNNSRDASEGQDNGDGDDDNRSATGSSRDKPPSRDMTPAAQFSEMNGIAEPISEREKRKIEAAEKLFEQEQPPRKKKRASDGPHANGNLPSQPTQKRSKPARPTASTHPSQSSTRQYKDAGTSRHSHSNTNSPAQRPSPPAITSPRSRMPSVAPSNAHSRQVSVSRSVRSARSNYVDASMQTDPEMDTDSWYSPPKVPIAKRRACSMATRLMNARLRTNALREARRAEEAKHLAALVSAPGGQAPGFESPIGMGQSTTAQGGEQLVSGEDVTMQDASPVVTNRPAPPIWSESMPAPSHGALPTMIRASPELKMTMPPTPSFSHMSTGSIPPTPNGTITPSSAGTSISQSPFNSVHLPSAFSSSLMNSAGVSAPSPVKKKLSLSDYKARMKRAPTASSLGHDSIPEETKAGILEGTAIVETPASDAKPVADPLAAAGAELANADSAMTGIETEGPKLVAATE